ncbi:PI-PLC X domain-containing protein 1 isoform X2 [Arvicola amphibius]|uniref:PI-PLC X domain-containing protein 1 isoform X2 n=1 Tax=Arvicola amphibius TaxID=1047088 RepID=UPI0018E35020|nr:PI-PLC X domain-containing protein 1 isoform X2 [Arvicola amphibius]
MEGGTGPKCRLNTHCAVGIATLAVCSLGQLGQCPAGLPASCPSLFLSPLKAACVAIPCSPLPPPDKSLPKPCHPHPSLQMSKSLTAGGWRLTAATPSRGPTSLVSSLKSILLVKIQGRQGEDRPQLGPYGWPAELQPCRLDVTVVSAAVGCPPAPPVHPRKSPISGSESRLLHLLGQVAPCIMGPMVLRWSVTQTLDVKQQLDAGVRYLDLRIAHMQGGSEKNLHFEHMIYTTALVEDTLTEISEWLESHPHEVIILACRNFEGMTGDLHEYLIDCIKNIFGDSLCPRGDIPTLRQLWAHDQQVIVSYEDETCVGHHAELWPGIPYWWGNQVKSQALLQYLETMRSCGRPGGLFVAGINLTENLPYVLSHPSGSLEMLTRPNLRLLMAWVRAQQPGPGSGCTNIIAGDFVGSNSFVGEVIGLNQKLLQ